MVQAKEYISIDNSNLRIVDSSEAPAPYGCLVNTDVNVNSHLVKITDMFLPNFTMRVSKGQFDQDAVFVNAVGEGLELMGTCLLLQGEIESKVEGSRFSMTSFNGSQNFKYDPNNIFIHKLKANNPFHIVHFSVKPEHLFQFLPGNEEWSENLKSKIEKKESLIGDKFTPITLLQNQALQNIFNCPLTGQLGQMMIETSITQIMLIQLHSIFQNDNFFPASANKKDIDLAQSVKDHLRKNFLSDHSIDSLAREFATNTNKLMMLFKKTFNKSIFEYLGELRMDYAHQLLEQREYKVAEVSRIVGYKNPHHFSTAFKKRFQINPSQLV